MMSFLWPDRIKHLVERLHEFFGRGPIRLALRSIYLNFLKHDGVQLVSAMAFDLFLALIPMLALAGWVVSSVLSGNTEAMDDLSLWLDLAPDDVKQIVHSHSDRYIGGAMAPVALGGALWLGSGAFNSVMVAFERTLPSDPRSWLTRRAIAISCVLFFLAALSLGAWVSVQLSGGPGYVMATLRALVSENEAPTHVDTDGPRTVGLLVSSLTITLLIAGFFRIGVRRDVPKRSVWPGTAVTLGLAAGASYLFSLYAQTLASYALYYGSLAAVAVILVWLWVCSLALLLGAELNVYLEETQR
ncbi:MAG: hypothetical protein RJA70_4969 [Pseudomonadota bacterium]|jgi:membrane protein